jgi:hypothetical protein
MVILHEVAENAIYDRIATFARIAIFREIAISE